MESFFTSFYISNMDKYHLMGFYLWSLLIVLGFVIQYLNTFELLKDKNDPMNVDLIKGEVKEILLNTKNAKFKFFTAMWILMAAAIFIPIGFSGMGIKWPFLILVSALIIQNAVHYKGVLSTAQEVLNRDENEDIESAIDKIIKEKEFMVTRETIYEKEDSFNPTQIFPFLKKIEKKDLNSLHFKVDQNASYYEDKEENIYEFHKTPRKYKLDKLGFIISPMYGHLYKPLDIFVMGNKALLEGFFASLVLYFSLIINT